MNDDVKVNTDGAEETVVEVPEAEVVEETPVEEPETV